jgi:membrane AbrB-like protein
VKINTRFLLLLLAATGLAAIFHIVHLPGAWMFGPLAASAMFAVRGWHAARFPNGIYIAGQALIGTTLGAGFSPATLAVIPQHAGIFTFAVVFILLTSLLNGWLLSRFTHLDAATSFLGTMPGGAGAMAAMSDSLRADTRLVTAIQYVRLLVILASLACVAPVLKAHTTSITSGTGTGIVFYSTHFVAWKFVVLLAMATLGWLASTRTPIPAAAFLVPTLLYFILSAQGIHLGGWPWPLLAAAYTTMGLQIGGLFHPETLTMIRRVILPVIGTTILLLVASVILAFLVARLMHLEFVSAYLAATPGGLDSVAAVATDLRVDTTIVVSMHLVRLLCVLLFGPWLVRFCAQQVRRDATEPLEQQN